MKTESGKTEKYAGVQIPGDQIYTVVPHICGSPACSLPHIVLVALEVWKIFGPLA
jgi:hypothetical protein